MLRTRSAFNEQQQFHLLIGLQGIEQQITVLPGLNRCFLIIDQGLILGELGFDAKSIASLRESSTEGELRRGSHEPHYA